MYPRPINILLVEDESPVLTIMTQALEAAGYVVYTAANGLDGLFLFKRHAEWDLAILDRAMPVMDGEQLAAQIRLIAADLPIMMVTGNVHGIVDPDPFQKILAKPFRIRELLAAVSSILCKPSPV